MRARSLIIIASVAALGACSTASTVDYAVPTGSDVSNRRIVNDSFEVTWDRLVRDLSADFFVINNIEKASRIINVSFSTDDPEEYVDCGKTVRTFTNAQGKTDTFRYDAAGEAQYWVSAEPGPPLPILVNRDTDLEGRVNIYVAPLGSSQTEVVVNSKYMLTVSQDGLLHSMYTVPMQQLPRSSSTVSFDTARPNDGDGAITCRSRGVLEQRILDLAG